MGAGEQRSAERGSPVYPPGRQEALRSVPRSAASHGGFAAGRASERAAQRTLAAGEGGEA